MRLYMYCLVATQNANATRTIYSQVPFFINTAHSTLLEKEIRPGRLIYSVCVKLFTGWLHGWIQRSAHMPPPSGRWGSDFLPVHITASAIATAITTAKQLRKCPNRLCNLVGVTERNQVDLPGLMDTARDHPQLQHAEHDKCTTGFCIFAILDSTKLEQPYM